MREYERERAIQSSELASETVAKGPHSSKQLLYKATQFGNSPSVKQANPSIEWQLQRYHMLGHSNCLLNYPRQVDLASAARKNSKITQ